MQLTRKINAIVIIIVMVMLIAYVVIQNENSYTIQYFSNADSYVSQSNDYYCGPASVQMILKYANCSILPTQDQLAAEMNCQQPAGTLSINIHKPFDNASYGNLTEYTVEYNTSYNDGGHAKPDYNFSYALTELKTQIHENHPAILLVWSDINHIIDNNTNGHYVVAYGYDAGGIYIVDPWGGVPTFLNNTALDLKWVYQGYWMFIYDGDHV